MRILSAAFAFFGILSLSVPAAHAEYDAALVAQLQQIGQRSQLDDAALKPWHMKMSFQLNDFDGKPKDSGTMEEWWTSPQVYKIVIQSKAFNGTRLHLHDDTYSSGDPWSTPYFVETINNELLDLFGRKFDPAKATMHSETLQSGDKILQYCIVLDHPTPATSTATVEKLCMQGAKDAPPIIYIVGDQTLTFKKLLNYHQKFVPTEITLQSPHAVLAKASVDLLEDSSMSDSEMKPTADMTKELDIDALQKMKSDNFAAPKVLKAPRPKFDFHAHHTLGSGDSAEIQVCMTIDAQGNQKNLEVSFAPDEHFANVAINNILTWKFSPAELDHKPISTPGICARIRFSVY